MIPKKQIQILQNTYAAVLADAVTNYSKLGILEQVTEIKNQSKEITGKMQLSIFGIQSEKEVFLKLAEIFECANWKLTDVENGFEAVATGCKLCAITKKMGGESPCNIYCLYPMMGMMKNLKPDADFDVRSTLWEADCCKVKITR